MDDRSEVFRRGHDMDNVEGLLGKKTPAIAKYEAERSNNGEQHFFAFLTHVAKK
ncbi:LLM class flavin-dependent oxidoreductase [Sesbania bispinosa]|nr:LLM class flavin-dependent oxidoreductase [Sesbania bispinosa]